MSKEELVNNLYLLENHDFIKFKKEDLSVEIIEVLIEEDKYNVFGFNTGYWFKEGMELHDFVNRMGRIIIEEDLKIADILKHNSNS